jgi:hypothetical protein
MSIDNKTSIMTLSILESDSSVFRRCLQGYSCVHIFIWDIVCAYMLVSVFALCLEKKSKIHVNHLRAIWILELTNILVNC